MVEKTTPASPSGGKPLVIASGISAACYGQCSTKLRLGFDGGAASTSQGIDRLFCAASFSGWLS
jgi:hypothetical protein